MAVDLPSGRDSRLRSRGIQGEREIRQARRTSDRVSLRRLELKHRNEQSYRDRALISCFTVNGGKGGQALGSFCFQLFNALKQTGVIRFCCEPGAIQDIDLTSKHTKSVLYL